MFTTHTKTLTNLTNINSQTQNPNAPNNSLTLTKQKTLNTTIGNLSTQIIYKLLFKETQHVLEFFTSSQMGGTLGKSHQTVLQRNLLIFF